MSKNESPIEVLLISPKQAAEALQVSERTVYAWMKAGRLPHVKIGGARRIPTDALHHLISELLHSAKMSLFDKIVANQAALEVKLAGWAGEQIECAGLQKEGF